MTPSPVVETPTSKIQVAEQFHWWVRYHLLHEGYETIAGYPTCTDAVRIAVGRLARGLDLPVLPPSTVAVQSLTYLHARVWAVI